ncbi:hypothetical protein Avbf_17314 [Armadillidium vulgare]|nr:hypothetical protein Avbf_10015 [Armadillidium vulgare]RXG61720.1 hypothetical protein Avbf_17314 [Armadillidium vulgare]
MKRTMTSSLRDTQICPNFSLNGKPFHLLYLISRAFDGLEPFSKSRGKIPQNSFSILLILIPD